MVSEALLTADPHARVDVDRARHALRVASADSRDALAAALEDVGYVPA
jgi:hypothetical protein